MANIVPKLNLNRTPNIVNSNSMVFAKNIRIDADGSIHKDYGIESLTVIGNKYHDNLITRIIDDFTKQAESDNIAKYYLNVIKETDASNNYSIIQSIPDNKSFYALLEIGSTNNKKSIIVKFDEEDNLFHPCNCNWTYSGGVITGCVINNLLGETILVIAEKSKTSNVPLKCINLVKSSYEDDESIYTQTPKIPITNLIYTGEFKYSIPNGVYQFFIRYKIRDNFYTNWFPASKELFAGNRHTLDTIIGTLGYHKSEINSDNSFIFYVQHLLPNTSNFKNFQIGFIVSNEGVIKARAWKHFSFGTTRINFDYKSSDAEEIEITDFTKPLFGVYNVGNVINFKNKLYVSNYQETNFNEDLKNIAKQVNINIAYKSEATEIPDNSIVYNDNICILGGSNNITGLRINGEWSIKELIDGATLTNVVSSAIKSKIAYDNTEECYHYIGGNHGSKGTGIYLKTTRNTFNINKPTKIIIGYDNTYNLSYEGSTVEEQENSFIGSLSDIMALVQEFYNVGYINSSDYVFHSNGTDYVNNEFINDNSLFNKDDTIDNFTIKIVDDNYIKGDDSTYDEITITPFIKPELLNNDVIPVIDNTTLIPYQTYNFYIHYVKETGETTNGFLVNTVKIENKNNSCDKIIYPEFSNIIIPEGYSACFFSIAHVRNQVSTIYNITSSTSSSTDGVCFELNTRLFSFRNKPTAYFKDEHHQKDLNQEVEYYNSNDTRFCRYFGAEGLVRFLGEPDNGTRPSDLKNAFIVNEYFDNDELNLQLVKCTPYIVGNSFSNFNNYNLLGYICSIYPLLTDKTTTIYTDGSSLFEKSSSANENIDKLQLTKYGDYIDVEPYIGNVNVATSKSVYIYSNFNLNYIQLKEDLKPKTETYYSKGQNATDNRSRIKMFYLKESLNLYDIYTLDSTYYNYTRKIYSVYNKDDIYKFDNTIRSSKLKGDEEKISIFDFDADDYYNIPTNRGKIVNLVSVGDGIIVHTRDSMFKFTGSNTLQSNTGEIQQTETDVFQTGVSEIFGSDFGFAGLQNKNAAITTEAGYIFYDSDSKIIYMYSGNGQIAKISDSIEKLFRYNTLNNVTFANDYYNNRFFVCLHYNDSTVTLSYSFNQESKSFVSLHDFKFDKAFNTKTKCYFITSTKQNVCRIDKSIFGLYRFLNIQDKIYPSKITKLAQIYKDSNNEDKRVIDQRYDSIVDIIDNTNYEVIKTLNYLNWNCSIINNEFPIYSDDTTKPFNALSSDDTKYPCKTITIYTDTCATKDLDCTNISNNYSINDINNQQYYQYPRYNQGYWTLNYFRNILNVNDEFNYLNQYNDGRTKAIYRSDNNSLIEGKYFVTRFTFDYDKDFKLETITFNYDNKL